MASILEIRKKIGAVKNTKKITKAMQLVAASKMRLFQNKALASRTYIWKLLGTVSRYLDTSEKNIYTKRRKTGKVLFVLYASDKGLCGGLNSQLFRALLRSPKWLETSSEDRLLITIGKKAQDFARANDLPIEHAFHGLPEKLSVLDALAVVDVILSYWESGTCREVLFAVPHYKNSFTFYPKLKTFLPFTKEMVESYMQEEETFVPREHVQKFGYEAIVEPNKQRLLEVLYQQLIENAFLQSFFELKASEYSSRMIAMQNATDNASKIIDNLTLTYNKTRQQVITQQLSEIVAAGEAIL